MKYTNGYDIVDADQYYSSSSRPHSKLQAALVIDGSDHMEQFLFINTSRGRREIFDTDWMVIYKDGSAAIYSDEDFKDEFKIISE